MQWLERLLCGLIGIAVGFGVAVALETATAGRPSAEALRVTELEGQLAAVRAELAQAKTTAAEEAAVRAVDPIAARPAAVTEPVERTAVIVPATEPASPRIRRLGYSRAEILAALRRRYELETRSDTEDFYGCQIVGEDVWCQIRGPEQAPTKVEINAIVTDQNARQVAEVYAEIAGLLWGDREGHMVWFPEQLATIQDGKTFGIAKIGIQFSVYREGTMQMASFEAGGE